jgi:hypothetical protein
MPRNRYWTIQPRPGEDNVEAFIEVGVLGQGCVSVLIHDLLAQSRLSSCDDGLGGDGV